MYDKAMVRTKQLPNLQLTVTFDFYLFSCYWPNLNIIAMYVVVESKPLAFPSKNQYPTLQYRSLWSRSAGINNHYRTYANTHADSTSMRFYPSTISFIANIGVNCLIKKHDMKLFFSDEKRIKFFSIYTLYFTDKSYIQLNVLENQKYMYMSNSACKSSVPCLKVGNTRCAVPHP